MNRPLSNHQSRALTLDRRQFLARGAAALIVPLNVGFSTSAAAATTQLGAYLQIDDSNIVTLFIGSTEMGQGIMTGLAQLVAEELQLSWSQIKVQHALASAAQPNPYGNPIFGAQLTGGSTSMRGWYAPLRAAGRIAAQTLIAAAQAQYGGIWQLQPGGNLTNGSNVVPFSAVVALATTLQPPPDPGPAGTPPVFIGQRMPRVDIPAKVNGSAVFGIDVKVPNMVYASVVHCPTSGGTVATMPAKPGSALAIVNLGNAVGVAASDTWTAMNLARSLATRIKWTLPANLATRDSASILANAQTLLTAPQVAPRIYETTGSFDAGVVLAGAATRIDATYNLPYLAHACMEVMNCTASVTPTSCEVWSPTQGQQFTIPTIMALTGLAAPQITVHTTFLGGGNGRKIEQDCLTQTVLMAKAIGRPVKLTWSRTQDFQNDKYRPCASIRVQAGLDASNNFSAMIYTNVSPSINIQRNTAPGNNPEDTGAVAGALGLPYAIGNRRIEYNPNLAADIPLGYWRSVGESYNTFAVESAVDELAQAAGLDPLAFRRTLLAADPRAVGVIDAVGALSGWGSPAPAGQARGVAFLKGFGSYIALVAQVSMGSTALRVNKMFCAIDCGIAVNPDSIEAQMQGGIAHGLSATLWGQISFAAGIPSVGNFDKYRVVRLADMPAIAVTIMQSSANPGGIGETGVPCVAPAVANAYAKLTGTRVRTLPFYPGATMGDG